MYAQDNNSLPVWIILSPAHHHISINSQPFLLGIVSLHHVKEEGPKAALGLWRQLDMRSHAAHSFHVRRPLRMNRSGATYRRNPRNLRVP